MRPSRNTRPNDRQKKKKRNTSQTTHIQKKTRPTAIRSHLHDIEVDRRELQHRGFRTALARRPCCRGRGQRGLSALHLGGGSADGVDVCLRAAVCDNRTSGVWSGDGHERPLRRRRARKQQRAAAARQRQRDAPPAADNVDASLRAVVLLLDHDALGAPALHRLHLRRRGMRVVAASQRSEIGLRAACGDDVDGARWRVQLDRGVLEALDVEDRKRKLDEAHEFRL